MPFILNILILGFLLSGWKSHKLIKVWCEICAGICFVGEICDVISDCSGISFLQVLTVFWRKFDWNSEKTKGKATLLVAKNLESFPRHLLRF